MARRKKTNEDQPNENSENINESDDTFGLPEIEYEPIKRDEPEEVPAEPISFPPVEEPVAEQFEEVREHQEHIEEEKSTYFEEPAPRFEDQPSQYSYSYHENESPVWPKALAILLGIIVVLGGALWYFMYYQPKQEEERRVAAAQLAASDAAFRKEKARQDSLKLIDDARNRRISDSLAAIAAKPAIGTIEMLEGRTGKYYVVVASNIDDDLLMDYAKELSGKGISSKIIPPHGKVRYFRLSIEEGDTYASMQTQADAIKDNYGNKVWVTKY
jgi:hypothetical protein